MIANRIGWQLENTEDIITPVIADTEIITKKIIIPQGYAAGVKQIGKGYINNAEKINLVFKAAVNEVDPYDSILIEGIPSFKSVIKGGINGDIATAAIVINAIKQIFNAKPGLRIMSDMPLLSFW